MQTTSMGIAESEASKGSTRTQAQLLRQEPEGPVVMRPPLNGQSLLQLLLLLKRVPKLVSIPIQHRHRHVQKENDVIELVFSV